ncbi:hypothetical protein RJ640_008128 [Escallonia rubra]|uniref:MIT domain-containing protein n=1 Tax=Escallonia rubra TaxID=112253 RepID=A0AA88RBS7_9ASTE|nr:hypothetical protein RJ640_008128 [Escallonia rubra]
MYSNFKEQAEYVKQPVQEDNTDNYAKAFHLYMNSLEYLKTHLKLGRGDRGVLDDSSLMPVANMDAAVASWSKTTPKNGKGGDGHRREGKSKWVSVILVGVVYKAYNHGSQSWASGCLQIFHLGLAATKNDKSAVTICGIQLEGGRVWGGPWHRTGLG